MDSARTTYGTQQQSISFNPRLIAFYLPQYHPIPENDEWWGPGFTEWRNVVMRTPLFRGHPQPHIPRDLGFYDLRLAETRIGQARMAAEYGISGFCYYHYWFAGRRLLETPFEQVLTSGTPDFPFCLCWANENWTRSWDGQSRYVLVSQSYSDEDDRRHIQCLARAFCDPRYIRIDGKPLFLVYRAQKLPSPARTTAIWREEAHRLGVGDLFLCRVESLPDERGDPRPLGFDAAVEFQPDWINLTWRTRPALSWFLSRALSMLTIAWRRDRLFDYATVVDTMLDKPTPAYPCFPGITPGWDNSARRRRAASILVNSTPALYEEWLRALLKRVAGRPVGEQVIFVNAWNEWGEGCHLEPDLVNERAYLEATRRAVAGSVSLPGRIAA